MSLTRKINNVTEFKASEISLLKTILHLDDKERGLSTIRNYITLKLYLGFPLLSQGLSTIRNYITLKHNYLRDYFAESLSTIRNYITLKLMLFSTNFL